MSVTLKDISKAANVHVSTVSRILSGNTTRSHKDSTVKKIREIADQLGYRTNISARNLVRGKSDFVAILLPDLADHSEYVCILGEYLREKNLQLIPIPTGLGAENQNLALQNELCAMVDCIICMVYFPENNEIYDFLTERGKKLIFRALDIEVEAIDFNCVGIDISDGYEQLLFHLVQNGYTEIAVLGGEIAQNLSKFTGKNNGTLAAKYFLDACKKLSISFDQANAITCDNSAYSAYENLNACLQNQPGSFDALIVQSNKLLPGAIHAIHNAKLSIPNDVGLVCVTDSPLCRFANPPITVWDQPIAKICKALSQALFAVQDNPKEIRKSEYSSQLIVRESSNKNS